MREAYRPASEVVRVIVWRFVGVRLVGEARSFSKELVVGEGDMGGVRKPLSGAMVAANGH